MNPRNLTRQIAILDHAVGTKLTRDQCLEILNASRGSSMVEIAQRMNVRIEFVRHVRYNCKWMRRTTTRPINDF